MGLKRFTEIRIVQRHIIADHRHVQRPVVILLHVTYRCLNLRMLTVGGTDPFNIFIHVQQQMLQISEIGVKMTVIVHCPHLSVQLQHFHHGFPVHAEHLIQHLLINPLADMFQIIDGHMRHILDMKNMQQQRLDLPLPLRAEHVAQLPDTLFRHRICAQLS